MRSGFDDSLVLDAHSAELRTNVCSRHLVATLDRVDSVTVYELTTIVWLPGRMRRNLRMTSSPM